MSTREYIISMMARWKTADVELLEAALYGLEHKRNEIEQRMAQLQRQLGVRGGRSTAKASGRNEAGELTGKKRTLGAAARRRIAAAQRKRWAEARKAKGEAPSATRGGTKRKMSAAARKRIGEATRKRWAEFRAKKAATAQKTSAARNRVGRKSTIQAKRFLKAASVRRAAKQAS